jgi:hypothetical protein
MLVLVSASDNTELPLAGETHWVALKYIDNADSVAPNAGWHAAQYWSALTGIYKCVPCALVSVIPPLAFTD